VSGGGDRARLDRTPRAYARLVSQSRTCVTLRLADQKRIAYSDYLGSNPWVPRRERARSEDDRPHPLDRKNMRCRLEKGRQAAPTGQAGGTAGRYSLIALQARHRDAPTRSGCTAPSGSPDPGRCHLRPLAASLPIPSLARPAMRCAWGAPISGERLGVCARPPFCAILSKLVAELRAGGLIIMPTMLCSALSAQRSQRFVLRADRATGGDGGEHAKRLAAEGVSPCSVQSSAVR